MKWYKNEHIFFSKRRGFFSEIDRKVKKGVVEGAKDRLVEREEDPKQVSIPLGG